jgi:predicted nucleic acid-binding protein
VNALPEILVADSSYLVHGLLKDATLLEEKIIISPDLALYEVTNTIWKHQVLLKDLQNGKKFLDLFYELVEMNTIQLVRPDRTILAQAYKIAASNRCSVYDAIFVALAQGLGLTLGTFDELQKKLAGSSR